MGLTVEKTKVCADCQAELPLSSFYMNVRTGWVWNVCKACHKVRTYRNHAANPDLYKGIQERHRRQQPDKYINYYRRYRKRHPEEVNARTKVAWALRTGRLVRPGACSACQTASKVEAHHDDYSKPLDIRWLCRSCHKEQR
jgi:hypothetical protein